MLALQTVQVIFASSTPSEQVQQLLQVQRSESFWCTLPHTEQLLVWSLSGRRSPADVSVVVCMAKNMLMRTSGSCAVPLQQTRVKQ